MQSSTFFSVSAQKAATATAIGLLLVSAQGNAATVNQQSGIEASTERSGIGFDARFGLGYLTGEAREYVYWPQRGGHKASELIWKIDSMYMAGIGGSLRPLDGMSINADLWFALGDGDGHMEDYDWLVIGSDWTHQSIHDNTDVTSGLMFDLNLEMAAFSAGSMDFTGLVGYRRDNFEWEARGGSYIYSTSSFRDTVGTFPAGELGITYEQTWDVAYFGLGLKGDFDRIHFNAKVIYSPFVSGEAVDHHHMRDLVTNDDFSSESMWALDIGIGYDISDALALNIAYFYEQYDTMTGDTEWHYNDIGRVVNITDGAGADLETSMFSMNMTYSF